MRVCRPDALTNSFGDYTCMDYIVCMYVYFTYYSASGYTKMTEEVATAQPDQSWPEEAHSTINDIKKHVKKAFVSQQLPGTYQRIFINLTTLEDKDYCVEMTASGFRITGQRHDDKSLHNSTIYETPYALLNQISEKYRKSFGGELMRKLMDLAKNSEEE